MLKELSWYIETDRFTKIVEEMEAKAKAYSEALKAGSEDREELREDLRAYCQWHMEKSGYKTDEVPYINIDLEFFNGNEINREALNTFEKEIIKAHMYQKHLWEFMGTTGSMTVISKASMKNDGFDYEKNLPLEYKKTHKPKSPISNILKENPDAVSFYIYKDGTVSSEYNPEKSKAGFNILKDKSGFDWKRKGWDPNYEVQKDGWHGEYDETGCWTMVREDNDFIDKDKYAGARFEKLPEIEILKDGEKAILYDPGYSLISTFERVFLLADGEVYGAEREDAERTVLLIKKAMAEIGTASIKAISGGKAGPAINKTEHDAPSKEDEKKESSSKNITVEIDEHKITSNQVLPFYKKLFGGMIEDNAEIKDYKEYRKIKEGLIEKAEGKRTEEKGKLLSEKIIIAGTAGAKGEKLIRAIQTEKVQVPLSAFRMADKKESTLTDDEFNMLQNYAVPEHRKELFSRAILNLLLERKMIETSGKEIHELFDNVYADVVEEKRTDEILSVETTFSELCNNPEKSLWADPAESAVIEKLMEAREKLPEQKTAELQKKVDAAVDNIIRNFTAVRMSTGMTPEEAVRLAAKTVGGKDSAVFVPPESGIVYQSSASSSFSARNGNDKRIFSDIRIAGLIDRAKSLPPRTKEAEVEKLIAESRQRKNAARLNPVDKDTAYEEFQTAGNYYGSFPNLFNREEREAWYESESFRATGLTVSDVEELVRSEKEIMQGLEKSNSDVITFSNTTELEKKLGYSRSSVQGRDAIIARIEPVTRSRNAEETVRELNEKSKASGISAEYKVAEVKTNGRLSRELAGAVKASDIESFFTRYAGSAENNGNINKKTNRHEETSQHETGNHVNIEDSVTRSSFNDSISETAGNVRRNAAQEVPQTQVQKSTGVTSDIKAGGTSSENHEQISSLSKPVLTPERKEEARLARMNANYEHDKAILAKTDPMFARNKFWDVGHAEGSGEYSNRDLEKLAQIRINEKKYRLLNGGHFQ